ncbi:class I SAM-dependent methyltransferase [Crossiella sp. SN42]|uniref:class I SAM-dependent methyltransferase n=1 Tax=Crossiella sp. SN42 TaxID=2944808 RepID=UPI00207CC7D9|nr:methyltransferase domain-containing protein [Crossiella sp. SN42]MCO1578990.1 class I SAM-dependent methyltransferase [Crossiella sp. SN42]
MDWVRDFYSRTGAWWAEADAQVTERDQRRVRLLRAHGPAAGRVLELGSGYGTTAVATARAGYAVTAVEVSDRVSAAPGLTHERLSSVQADFFEVELPGEFDAVCYWNGFGVGSDDDQRRLLTRIAGWLRPGGVALVDVFNPFVWAGWHGDEEHLLPDPARGYRHELRERTSFDPVTCTATDTWWDVAEPDRELTQTLRCYTPADLGLLLTGTGLALSGIVVGEDEPAGPGLLREHHEYLAVLRPS